MARGLGGGSSSNTGTLDANFFSNFGSGTSNPYLKGFGFTPQALGGTGGSSSGLSTQQQKTQQQEQTASRQTQNTTTGQQTQQNTVTGENTRQNTVTGSQTNQTEQSTTQSLIDRMDPNSRAAFNELLATLTGGGSGAMREQQDIFLNTLRQLAGQVQAYSPESAAAMASGNVAGLSRQMMEQIMPQILGAQESAGLSGDALTALLSQDAASRTAEAQQRAQLEAIMGLGGLQQGSMGQLLQASSQQDPITAALMQALDIGKGSFESGLSNTLSNMLSSTNGFSNMTGTTTGFSNMFGNTTGFSNSVTDALTKSMSMGQQIGSSSGGNDELLRKALAQSMLPPGSSLADAGTSMTPTTFRGLGGADTRSAQAARAMAMAGISL